MSTPDTSAYTTEAGTVYLQAGQSYAVTSNWPIAIIVFPEGGEFKDVQLVALMEKAGGAFEFTSTVTGHGLIMANTEDSPDALVTTQVRAVFNRAPGASSSGTGGSSSSSAPTPPWVAYNADRSGFTAADFTGLTVGDYLFYGCSGIIIFSRDLAEITRGIYMFRDCTGMISFSGNLSALTNGYSMFFNCTGMISFSGDLYALTNGDYMFYSCINLTSFSCDLYSLTNGDNMFSGCKLDKASILRILNTIPAYTSGTRKLTIGMAAALNGDPDIAAALTAASAKGWTVTAQYN